MIGALAPGVNSPSQRIVYAIGPGDVVASYRAWRAGTDVPHETAQTYSGQFFDFCCTFGHVGYAISSFSRAEVVEGDGMTVENRPKPRSGTGMRYHLSQALYGLSIMWTAVKWRADALVVDSGTTHWSLLLAMKLFGIPVVACLHNSLWPNGCRPTRKRERALLRADGAFFRHGCEAVLAISPECERQVREIAPGCDRFIAYRAQYRPADFDGLPPPPSKGPFRIVFAGRVERNKGALDLVEIAAQVERAAPGRVRFVVCGGGGAIDAVNDAVRERGLDGVIGIRGPLKRTELLEVYAASHAVIVPTRSDFCEGLPKSCVEGLLAGRPVITSRLSNALDVMPGAIFEATADDPTSYAAAILKLAADPSVRATRTSSAAHRDQFVDGTKGLAAALESACLRSTNRRQRAVRDYRVI